MYPTLIASIMLISAIAAFLVFRRGISRIETIPSAAWLYDFSPERYRPMLRMLDEKDFRWLASQGLETSEIRALRSERRRIFGTYLRNLQRDFRRLHAAASALVLALPEDQPELAGRLVAVRVEFQRTVLQVRFHLLLHRLGLHSVDASSLVAGIEAMHRDISPLLSVHSRSHA